MLVVLRLAKISVLSNPEGLVDREQREYNSVCVYSLISNHREEEPRNGASRTQAR